jgi:site-specific recombinase XerD
MSQTIAAETATIEELLKQFRHHLEARDRSPHSIRAYLSDLRQFAAWFAVHTGEPFTLEAATEYDVRDWRDHLAATMKPATVNRKLAALSTLYRWAGETGQSERDPTRYVNGIEQQPVAPKALSKQGLTRILRQARQGNKRDAALLEFLAATGLRASEVAGLMVSDVELNERSGWVTVRGKGRKQRNVPLHVRARRALSEYLEERGDPAGDEPLFLSQKGGAITPYAVWYTVKKYAVLADVDGVTPHTFRHTVATQLVRDPEVDLVTAATFLGHSRLDTTARYSQPSAEDLEEAANRLG